jgi:Aldo/keto reductase family
MAADDWRRRNAEFKEPLLSRNLALRDALQPIAARYGVSIAAVAVAWTLSWPGVSGAIVGARTAKQVDGWIAAGNRCCMPKTWQRSRLPSNCPMLVPGPRSRRVDDDRGTWLEHGLDPSSLEGAIARMVLPVSR